MRILGGTFSRFDLIGGLWDELAQAFPSICAAVPAPSWNGTERLIPLFLQADFDGASTPKRDRATPSR